MTRDGGVSGAHRWRGISPHRWVASIGILIALVSAGVHYLVAPPQGGGVVAYVAALGPVWSLLFLITAGCLIAALVVGRLRYAAHVAAAAALSTYAVALWGTAIDTASTRGITTAGLATALALHALLLAAIYSPGGVPAWTRR